VQRVETINLLPYQRKQKTGEDGGAEGRSKRGEEEEVKEEEEEESTHRCIF
tara:strand:- start:119 stop:271 length:153 start_codon:yes stop_codon:yes gene_type:complete